MTKIPWCDEVWNAVSGCSKISEGCRNCYAESIANRFWGERKFTDVRCHPDRLDIPLHWKKPRRIFVDSMSDLFHPDVPDEFVLRVWDVMKRAYWHTFIVLTKRPHWMNRFFMEYWPAIETVIGDGVGVAYPDVWLGVSCENQQAADERIPILLQTPAEVRFVSCEPMLGEIDLCRPYGFGVGELMIDRLDWVICGGESGPNHRPMNLDWARSLRDQCVDAGVPFFYKQESGLRPGMNPTLDGVVWNQYPGGVA